MHILLDDKLCRDFPLLFANRWLGVQTSNMCFGFECGDGWEPLIRKLAEKLEPLIAKHLHMHKDGWVRATQVKEKYGTLRFYISGGTDEMYALIDAAERKSARVCESCGRPGKLRGKTWLFTACARHAKQS